MTQVVNALIILIALQHVGFLILESFLWTKPIGLRTFGMTAEKAEITAKLAANQGLYNGFLAAGLVWGLFFASADQSWSIKMFFVGCIGLAGIVGGLTVSRSIFIVQGVPAIVTGLLLLMMA